ncbi:hypothetical protein [Shewanella youngdeokensis]|uniref:Uncharacterized protein n=1 Tax=Shewanella youngdeokensis TaxID=2999068 RepID=A0ABZ0JX24_9GAMM|nr:hypothetical protein RGE70_16325 [Shewanella sp. DAU334]
MIRNEIINYSRTSLENIATISGATTPLAKDMNASIRLVINQLIDKQSIIASVNDDAISHTLEGSSNLRLLSKTTNTLTDNIFAQHCLPIKSIAVADLIPRFFGKNSHTFSATNESITTDTIEAVMTNSVMPSLAWASANQSTNNEITL